MAPQQTYVCAGWSYEAELAGAAELRVGVETCGDSGGVGGYGGGVGGQFGVGGYGGYGGYYAIGGQYAVGGYSDSPGGAAYGGQDGRGIGGGYPVPIGGAEQGGASSIGGSAYGGFPEAVGGAVSVGGWSYGGVGGDYYFPPTGGAFSTGGADGSTGPNWCDSEPRGTVLGGLSFAVGACQDIDVELPLVFEEPYSGEYVMHVYGGYGPCDRGTLLTTVAGVGRGQLLQVPFHTEGYTFISVEVFADSWYDFGVRLRDRPIVVPTAPPTE